MLDICTTARSPKHSFFFFFFPTFDKVQCIYFFLLSPVLLGSYLIHLMQGHDNLLWRLPLTCYSFSSYIKVCSVFWLFFKMYILCEVGLWLLNMDSVPALFVEKGVLSLSNCFDTFIENQLTINVEIYFWILSSILLVCMAILTDESITNLE